MPENGRWDLIRRLKVKPVYTMKDRAVPAIYYKSLPVWEKLLVQYTLQANAETVPQIRPRSIPTTSLPFHYSLIILPFDTVYAELATTLLNNSQFN